MPQNSPENLPEGIRTFMFAYTALRGDEVRTGRAFASLPRLTRADIEAIEQHLAEMNRFDAVTVINIVELDA